MQGLTGNCPAKCGQLPYRMVSPLRRRFVGVGHEKILKPCETTVLDTAKVMFQQDFKAIMFPVLRGTSGYPCCPQCDLKRPTSTKQPPPLTTSLSGSSSNFSLMNLRFFAWTMVPHGDLLSGNLLQFAFEHGPVEIVSFPIFPWVFLWFSIKTSIFLWQSPVANRH